MKHLSLTFNDIAQKNILYYDKAQEKACHNICEALKIDNMPAYDSRHYYELKDKTFQKKKINKAVQLHAQQHIFKASLLKQFKNNKHNVLFVYKGEVLMGVVHFSDYNQTKVLQAIQDDVLTFERRMRQYFFLMNYRNKDMIAYFTYRAKNSRSSRAFYQNRIQMLEKRSTEMNQLGEFQLFDLKDLLEFGNSRYSKKLFPAETMLINDKTISEITLITSLRNIAMHGKNPIEKDQHSSVYSLDSLKYLFTALNTLEKFTYRIENLINKHEDYQKSIQMDNRSKLEIIDKHHPKALNYFIGS